MGLKVEKFMYLYNRENVFIILVGTLSLVPVGMSYGLLTQSATQFCYKSSEWNQSVYYKYM